MVTNPYQRMSPQAKTLLKVYMRHQYAKGDERDRLRTLINDLEWMFPHAATELDEAYGGSFSV